MKRLFNSLYSVKSVLIITTYSVNGETQPFLTASSIVILSHTGAYFLINSSFPSKRSKVPVKHKINLYLTTLKIVENEGLAKRWTSSSISKSHSHCFLITELIISIWQFPNRFLSITFSSHCSFNISVGTTIKTKISGFFSTNKSIISRATRVFLTRTPLEIHRRHFRQSSIIALFLVFVFPFYPLITIIEINFQSWLLFH